jgi:UDP-glucose 4-epimerase
LQLSKKDYNIIVLDNLSLGHEKSLPKNIKLLKGDIRDEKFLDVSFSENKIDYVMVIF